MSDRHELKCWDEYYDAIERGDKSFEIRWNDRNYAVGDELVLVRSRGDEPTEPRQELTRRVTFLTGAFQREGYVVMSLAAPVEPPVLSREFLDAKIDEILPEMLGMGYDSADRDHDRAVCQLLRDAILESLSQDTPK